MTASNSPFMDGYSSEDYEDCDDDYCFVPAAPMDMMPQITHQIDDDTRSNEILDLIIDRLEIAPDSSESGYYDVLPALLNVVEADAALEAENAVEGDTIDESSITVELDAETAVEDAIEEPIYEAVPDLDADLEPEESIDESSESDASLEAGNAVEESNSDAAEAEDVEEGDEIEDFSEAITTGTGAAAPPTTSFTPVWAPVAAMDSTGGLTVPVHDLEALLGCNPLVMLQECRTTLIRAIETFLREVARLRLRLRRFFSSLFRKRKTSKYT